MGKAKQKPTSPFTRRWRIVSISARDEDFIDDDEEEGYFEFDDFAPVKATREMRRGLPNWR